MITCPKCKHRFEQSKTISKDRFKMQVQEVVEYMNKRLNSRYRMSGATTKHIYQRFVEGFKVEDFKLVIDKKYNEWKGTEMAKFLRPQTLFSPSKFESYLNQQNPEDDQWNDNPF